MINDQPSQSIWKFTQCDKGTLVGNSPSHFDLPECSMQIFQFMLKLKTRVVNAGYGVDLEQCMVIHAGI